MIFYLCTKKLKSNLEFETKKALYAGKSFPSPVIELFRLPVRCQKLWE